MMNLLRYKEMKAKNIAVELFIRLIALERGLYG